MDPRETIRAAAAGLGFAACGFSAIEPLPRARYLRDWLAEGRAGEMIYLKRRPHGRLDPRRLLPWAQSVVSLAFPYPPPPAPPRDWRIELRGRIAAYALGTDYHETMAARLQRLATAILGLGPGVRARPYVDTGPVLEREWGRRGGLGWIGKNTMLLDRTLGSWFLLGEIFASLPLAASVAAGLPDNHCGTCRRCLDLCPTGALAEGPRIDPRLCISYLTIEHRGAIPVGLRPPLDNWIFGCDRCQDVCPWNAGEGTSAAYERLYPRLPEVLLLDDDGFRARYGGTALARAKRRGLARNAAVALGNSRNPDAVPALAQALDGDADALVRGHAAWALGRLGGRRAGAALGRARRRESDETARREIDAALGAADGKVGNDAAAAAHHDAHSAG